MKLSISGINMIPNSQENVFENQNAHEKLDLLPNVYQNKFLWNAKKFFV
jgi:hypothetical protein